MIAFFPGFVTNPSSCVPTYQNSPSVSLTSTVTVTMPQPGDWQMKIKNLNGIDIESMKTAPFTYTEVVILEATLSDGTSEATSIEVTLVNPCGAESIFDGLAVDPSELDRSYSIGSGAQYAPQPTVKVSGAFGMCEGYQILSYQYAGDVIYLDSAQNKFYIDSKDQSLAGTIKYFDFVVTLDNYPHLWKIINVTYKMLKGTPASTSEPETETEPSSLDFGFASDPYFTLAG